MIKFLFALITFQHGIIGSSDNKDDSFSSPYSMAQHSIGVLHTAGAPGEDERGGVASIVKFKGSTYVLTARHVLYDPQSGKLDNKIITFIEKPHSEIQIKIEPETLPTSVQPFGVDGDLVLIPLLLDEWATRVWPIPVLTVSENVSARHDGEFSMGTAYVTRKGGKFRFHKYIVDNVYLKFDKSQSKGVALTSADAVKGMSGSPIFYKPVHGDVSVIGVLSQQHQNGLCVSFDLVRCHNTVRYFQSDEDIRSMILSR